MNIDGFTVISQALNFLILVWLMKRYLYRPILNAIDAREKKIAAQLADADARREEAKGERREFIQKNEAFDRERAALVSKASSDAEVLGQKLIQQARHAADEFSAKRHLSMQAEARNLNDALIHRTQQEVLSIARKTLADLAGASLEEKMCDVFTQRLRDMDSATHSELADAMASSSRAVIRSAFELPAKQREAIQREVGESFESDVRLHFENAPEIVSGIEMSVGGKKLAWSIADYLTSLEAGVSELLGIGEESDADDEPAIKVEVTQPIASLV